MLQGIPELRLINQSVHYVNIISLRLECHYQDHYHHHHHHNHLECPEQPIPNDQHCSIILVKAVSIRPMMNLEYIVKLMAPHHRGQVRVRT